MDLIAGEIVLPNHYATLGIAPSSRPAAIRAAYVELMRRYHPDVNPSATGAARVRVITAAYAVLGVPDRRAAYDLERTRLVAATGSVFMAERPHWRLTPLLAVSFGLAVIVLLLPLLIPPPFNPPERSGPTSSVGGRQQAAPLEQDELTTAWNPAALCSSPAAARLIKRELFRRAARLRGIDRAAYDRLADYSLLRFDPPLLARAKSGTVSCNASVAVELPPSVATMDGRRTVSGKIAYAVRGDGSYNSTISVISEGPIVGPLATLAQTSGPSADAAVTSAAPEDEARGQRAHVVEQMSPVAQPAEAAVARAQAIQARPKPPQPRPATPVRRAGPAAEADQKPAWQQPLKPAWQRPLPPSSD
ncbi:MAG: J domain-containing protein [Sphingomicrobium sp.]